MDQDRRESLRREVTLPFRWRVLDGPVTVAELSNLFALSPAVALTGHLAELESEYGQARRQIGDRAVAAALDVINARVSAIADTLAATHPAPPPAQLELSAGGLAFEAPEALTPGSWLGVHLVLPTCHHILCTARVCRCDHDGHFRVAARLECVDPPASRRLSRFVIGNK